MPDKEKVISGLELCTNISPDGCLMLCPYKDEKDETYSGFCEQVLKQDALDLLKAQEEVFANLVIDWLREIALNNFDCNRDMTFLDAVEDIRDRASYGLKQYFVDKMKGGKEG